jgi:hypothetical protein
LPEESFRANLDEILPVAKTLAKSKKDYDRPEPLQNRDTSQVKNELCEGTQI